MMEPSDVIFVSPLNSMLCNLVKMTPLPIANILRTIY
ncbi:MAG: hypothetical protein H6Q65_167 [Firmicutes bacterium]|nr:hypothetical protein [Bacillota bacterium]